MVQRLSPDFTVYDVAGVTSARGADCCAPATGDPGRVGESRTPVSVLAGAAEAGASGLKVIADEPEDGSRGAGVAVVSTLGAGTIGDAAAAGFEPPGAVDGLVVLQP